MKEKQGISLIVLVITIIVMVVLAGAIVLTLNNGGIIDKAEEAVNKTNYATVKELTQMAWAEAYANGARTQQEFQDAVDKALTDNKIDTDKYGIIVTTNGVEVANGWIQDGLTVKRGNDVLNIGSEFTYEAGVEGYEGGWKVLGAENGELLIMSTVAVVENHLLGDDTFVDLDVAVNDYLNGVAELDGLCEAYGKGENATGARSIRVEDVNKITGYDPETAKYGKGNVYEYGNEVTYSYAGTGKIKYYSKVTAPEKEVSCSTFYYLDKTTNTAVPADLATGTGIIIKLKSNYYEYDVGDLETIEYGSDAYAMLFGEDDKMYWLASPSVTAGTDSVFFGMRYVFYGGVDDCGLWRTDGVSDYYVLDVRAVVSLASDIQI